MDVLGTVINAVLLVLTAAVVWFAWQTVKESREATGAAQKTVSAVEELLTAAQETAAASAASVEAARQTVEIARAAREADERYRQLEHLRQIGQIVQRIKLTALAATVDKTMATWGDPRWKSSLQNDLGALLVGVEPPLPKCSTLVGESQASQVANAAIAAEAELDAVFHDLGVG
jgi:hypothetical protein